MVRAFRWQRLSLRTQLLCSVFVLLSAFGIIALCSIRSHTKLQLENRKLYDQKLALVTKFYKLDEELRHIDLVSEEYLLTGDHRFFEEREGVKNEFDENWQAAKSLAQQDRDDFKIFSQLGVQVDNYFASQSALIHRKQTSTILPDEILNITTMQGPIDGLVASIVDALRKSIRTLNQSRELIATDSRNAIAWIVVLAAIANLLLLSFLSTLLLKPLNSIFDFAKSWDLSSSHEPLAGARSRETELIFAELNKMTGRLRDDHQQTLELVKLKTSVASLISHELNNTLNVIQVVTQRLERGETAISSERKELYAAARANVQSLCVAAKNILSMTKIDTGGTNFNLESSVDVKAIIEETLSRLNILCVAKGLETKMLVPDDCCHVKADQAALSLVVANLLSNAVKYTPKGGSLTVSATRSKNVEALEISVTDTGIGIPEGERLKIFDEFYRTKDGEQRANGFGIGLSLCKKIVEGHGSTLQVQSTPGKGSKFYFSLQVAESTTPNQELN